MKEIKDIIGRAINDCSKAAAGAIAIKKRFRFPLEAGEAAALLLSYYKIAVEERGRIYIADNETARRLQSIANWLTNPNCKPSLLLHGSQPGTGKTTTAAAIDKMARGLKEVFNAQAMQDKICREAGQYIPLEDEERMRLTMCENAVIIPAFYTAGDLANLEESNKTAFENAKHSSFLIIDDMGTEPVSVKLYGNEYFPIIEILQYRYAAMLPTIITSNLGLSSITNIYGQRISDRLGEMCEILFFAQGESYRRR